MDDRIPGSRSRSGSGFTLVELLVVCAVIIALLGIGFPIYATVRAEAEVDGTRVLVRSVAAGIASYARRTWSWSEPGRTDPLTRPLWDLDGDQVLDGHPDPDGDGVVAPGFPQAAFDGGYSGFLAMVQPELDERWIGPQGRVIDAWGEPLRIGRPVIAAGATDAEAQDLVLAFGAGGVRVWSTGPDRLAHTDDDIVDALEAAR